MARIEGAIADPATRWAMVRSAALAVGMFVGSLVLLVTGFSQFNAAETRQDTLVREGKVVPALVLTVDQPISGIDRATFSYRTGDEQQRQTLIVFNRYQRGQKVTAYVDRNDITVATLAGETPQSGPGWLVTVSTLLLGSILLPLAVRRLLRAGRTWSVLRIHPWAPWTMRAVYPKRRRLAAASADAGAATELGSDEHLIRLDSWAARRLGRYERKSPLYLAGSGRWFVVSLQEGRRMVALGRMDEPYERFRLVNPGAAPSRFDVPDDVDATTAASPTRTVF